MTAPTSVTALLDRLTPDQRAAATAPPGPVLCVAPAGSGKTTTLVARVAWLVAEVGAEPDRIAAITFNRRAAEELRARLDPVLGPLGVPTGAVRVRTFHALGLEILRASGRPIELADRQRVLRELRPAAGEAELRAMDEAISRLKLDLRVDPSDIRADPGAGPLARTAVAYADELARSGRLDFDDLVAASLALLESDPRVLATWREACSHLLVDEVQDVDRSQLELALLLAAPGDRIFLVGDDDQSIYGWRLADVRRVLGLAGRLPGLRRHDLVTNFRCPGPVVRRAVRLVEHNRERFPKQIAARPGAPGRLALAPDGRPDVERWRAVLGAWPEDDGTQAILTRTNRELIPAVAAAVELGRPFRAPRLDLPLESPHLDGALDGASALPHEMPMLLRLDRLRQARDVPPTAAGGLLADRRDGDGLADRQTDDGETDASALSRDATIAALLAWAPPFAALEELIAAVRAARDRLASLRRDDAPLTLATAHGTKGLEFDHVAVLMDEERFPNLRSLEDASDPGRALEEERRLAYVAWTRARRSLVLVFDPAHPSVFLREAFSDDELGLAA